MADVFFGVRRVIWPCPCIGPTPAPIMATWAGWSHAAPLVSLMRDMKSAPWRSAPPVVSIIEGCVIIRAPMPHPNAPARGQLPDEYRKQTPHCSEQAPLGFQRLRGSTCSCFIDAASKSATPRSRPNSAAQQNDEKGHKRAYVGITPASSAHLTTRSAVSRNCNQRGEEKSPT